MLRHIIRYINTTFRLQGKVAHIGLFCSCIPTLGYKIFVFIHSLCSVVWHIAMQQCTLAWFLYSEMLLWYSGGEMGNYMKQRSLSKVNL